jgi:signal transduction histidine kinase
VAYVLVAGPRGIVFALVLLLGLALDLPILLLRLLLATVFGLLSTTARLMLWLVRFGLRFLWVAVIVILVWSVQSLRWLLISIGITVIRAVSTILVDIIHPRSAWQRAVRSMRADRERIRSPRPTSAARVWAGSAPFRERGDRFVDAFADGIKRWRHQVAPGRWTVVPEIWLRLALWERRHTMRWLNIELPPLGPFTYGDDGRTAVWTQLPPASLGYLLAKVLFGGIVVLLIGFAAVITDGLIHGGYEGVSVVTVLVLIYLLHLLANVSARFAQRAFSPSTAMRRIHAAEALVVQERGKAERAEQSRRDLIINVGHELRTPTASILGHIESVLLSLDAPDQHVPPDTLRTYLGIVQREAERLSSLVDDLLAVARAERDELQLVLAPVDAAEVIHEVHQALAPLARRERQVMLVHEEQHNLPPLLADRQRLSQVLLNLVRNAITYTPPGGIVSIALRRIEGDRLLLTVADTGSGIAPADLERVFERFYRADASRTRESGGFGLGLAIARDLVEAMGGTITAESIVGEGSYFHVTLPIAPNVP